MREVSQRKEKKGGFPGRGPLWVMEGNWNYHHLNEEVKTEPSQTKGLPGVGGGVAWALRNVPMAPGRHRLGDSGLWRPASGIRSSTNDGWSRAPEFVSRSYTFFPGPKVPSGLCGEQDAQWSRTCGQVNSSMPPLSCHQMG